jgi:hypothetical protein
MTMILLYLLGMAGLTLVITTGKITEPIRKAFKPPIGSKGLSEEHPAVLLHCPMCCGTWIGLFFGLLYVLRAYIPPEIILTSDGIMFAFASSLISYVIFAWLNYVKAP